MKHKYGGGIDFEDYGRINEREFTLKYSISDTILSKSFSSVMHNL